MGYTPVHQIDEKGHWFQWGATKLDYDYTNCKVIYPSEVIMDRDYPSPSALMRALPAYARHGISTITMTNDEQACTARLKPGVHTSDDDQADEITLWNKSTNTTFERTAYKLLDGLIRKLDSPVTILGFQSKDDGTWGQSSPLTSLDQQLVSSSIHEIPTTYGKETRLPNGWENMPAKTIARLVAKAFLHWYEDDVDVNYYRDSDRDDLIDLTTGYGVILVDALTIKILENGVIKTIDGKTVFTGKDLGRGVKPVTWEIIAEPVD